MFIMRSNDSSRLRRAARRTIRAEATLVIVIIIITTWSVYGLYKLSIGASDSIFGLTFAKSVDTDPLQTAANQSKLNEVKSVAANVTPKQTEVSNYQPSESSSRQQQVIYSQPNEAKQWHQNMVSQQRDGDFVASRTTMIQLPPPIKDHSNIEADISANIRSATDEFKDLRRGFKLPTKSDDVMESNSKKTATARSNANQYNTSNGPRLALNLPSLMQVSAQAANLNGNNNNVVDRTYEDQTPLNEPEPNLMDDVLGSEMDEDPRIEDLNDRVPAESSRDTSEAVLRSNDAEGYVLPSNNEETSQGDLETTTETPSEEGDQDSVNAQDDSQPTSADSTDNEENVEPSTTTEEPDKADDESLRETGHAIDEEVDRMTQPSSGRASQHEKPFDYKSTVQFDDNLAVPSHSLSQMPATSSRLNKLIGKTVNSRSRNNSLSDQDEQDLQVDHNSRVSDVDETGKRPSNSEPQSDRAKRRKSATKRQRIPDETEEEDQKERQRSKRLNRQKRSSSLAKVDSIKAPYEIGKFLDALNFDSLSGKADAVTKSLASSSINQIEDANSTAASNNVESIYKTPAAVNDANHPIRREFTSDKSTLSDSNPNFDDANEIDNGSVYDDPYTSKRTLNNDSSLDNSRYHYLTSNDTGLQELLGKKKLLNALEHDQLPPPTERPPPIERIKSAPNSTDHQQAADSLFTVDHGLLLYPAADEKHHHKTKSKSMSKKHKKQEKSKKKKKMTVAMKKGGHKKKKHKKEMKKFIKEKKFKGAKKGKKVSKGKGGQGGKKGKKLYKDKGFKKKGFKNVYHKEEFGQKKSYFDEYRDKDFKKKWKKFDDKYNYAKMKKWQAKDVKGAKKIKDHHEKYKKYDKSKWKKKYEKHSKEHSEKSSKKKHKKSKGFD